MGVYIFQSRHEPWVKVGHHRITERRPNVYFRIVPRGFNSCACPPNLEGHVSFMDVKLYAWYPNLTSTDERNIHSILRRKYLYKGEWYHVTDPLSVSILIKNYGGIQSHPTREDLEQTLINKGIPLTSMDSILD